MIISFAHTTPALVMGDKHVTRREWKDSHAMKFYEGMICDAWDKSPRYSGKKVGRVEIVEKPYQESTAKMTSHDFVDEGFSLLDEINYPTKQKKYDDLFVPWGQFFEDWSAADEMVWVVRFRLIYLTVYGRYLKRQYEKQLESVRR